ncbi:MAG TPA: asparagine synthase (glutamine-hydrolyzing) [Tepidisphaeraceae bacterium]|jgi:asparagine synthase (glutamine-hydrolysing)|nr:asparagine synthase (glutamine-hydrolyzing) [Tepidisphaeraceae bacterium]
MCGIAGYVDFASGAPDPAMLAAMAFALRRRGPDAHGTLIDGPCGLAHTRLSIIDLAGSPQPMQLNGNCSDVSGVFNGEIYNYQQLRTNLVAHGERFETSGDTEVLLRWVAREWNKALPRFDGMFAFGAWDRRRRSLLLGRDAIGEKPLFYSTPRPGLLVFGSEVKAVLEHPEVNTELDNDALRQALRFRAVYGERSLHRGVRQLPPGHFLEFSASGVVVGRFYNIADEAAQTREAMTGLGETALIEHGEKILRQSVAERLIGDVPVGAFLSGGLDSSLIVALMRQLRAPGEEVRTFSVGFDQDRFSELPFARTVANAIGTQHTEVHVSQQDYVRRLSELSACRDGPVSEPADVAVAEMSRIARQSVKVVLSGEGSDEVFCGYPKYQFARANWMLRQPFRLAGPRRTAWVAGMFGVDRRRALVAARALSLPSELDRITQWFSYLDRADLQHLLPGLGWSEDDWISTTDSQRQSLHQASSFPAAERMQIVDCLTWLPGNMLERGDRMTMAEGLEARVPFLDKELVAFGLALPSNMKIRGKTLKWIARRWASKHLPSEIFNRPKWGFRVPLAEWFHGDLRPLLHDYLESADGLCGTYGNRAAVSKLLEQHDSRIVDVSLTLWTLLSAEIWYRDVYLARRSQRMHTSQVVA